MFQCEYNPRAAAIKGPDEEPIPFYDRILRYQDVVGNLRAIENPMSAGERWNYTAYEKRKGNAHVKNTINFIEKCRSINSINWYTPFSLNSTEMSLKKASSARACACVHVHLFSFGEQTPRDRSGIPAPLTLPPPGRPSFSEKRCRSWDNKNIDISRSLRLKQRLPESVDDYVTASSATRARNWTQSRRAARVDEYARVTKACLLPRATFFSTYLSRTRTDRPRVLRHVGDPPAAACTISPPFLPRFIMRR